MSSELSTHKVHHPVNMSVKEFESKVGFNSIDYSFSIIPDEDGSPVIQCTCGSSNIEPIGLGIQFCCADCGLVIGDK